jgi:5-methyltetrahydrofolate--homocysteine methyltransferase
MSNVRRLDLKNVIPLIHKQSVYNLAWGMNKRKQDHQDILAKFNAIFDYLSQYILNLGVKGIVYFDVFPVHAEGDTLIFNDTGLKWSFPRINKRCIVDSISNNGQIALQVVTLGRSIEQIIEKLDQEDRFSVLFYFHGFSVWLTEALADYHHTFIRQQWKSTKPMERYSFGYPLCPDLRMQKELFNLLKIDDRSEVSLLPSFMMTPEQSTSAIIFS